MEGLVCINKVSSPTGMMIPERDDSNEVGFAGERFQFKQTAQACSITIKPVKIADDGPWTCYIRIQRGNSILHLQKTTFVNVTEPGYLIFGLYLT